jgi:hypothetical protein
MPPVLPVNPMNQTTLRPPPVPVPEGDPAKVGALLAAARVDTADHATLRLTQLARDLEAAVEAARIDPTHHWQSLEHFVKRCGIMMHERANCAAKGTGGPPNLDFAGELCLLVRSVSAWKDGDTIRTARQKQVRIAREAIARCKQQAQDTIASPSDHYHALTKEQMLRDRLGLLLSEQQGQEARLARLDVGGDASRAAQFGSAVGRAGGEGKVIAILADVMPDADSRLLAPVQEKEKQIGEVTEKRVGVDPDSNLYRVLSGTLDGHQAALRALRAQSLAARVKVAATLVSDAVRGGLDALGSIAPHAGAVGADFASAIALARGTDSELVETIADMVQADREERDAIERAKVEARRRARGGS